MILTPKAGPKVGLKVGPKVGPKSAPKSGQRRPRSWPPQTGSSVQMFRTYLGLFRTMFRTSMFRTVYASNIGFKPLLPWVKRHILESATFHLTYSVPGSFSLKWSHPEAFTVAQERSEVACVVCARKDWLESRFKVHLWQTADGSSTVSELQHADCGTSRLLTYGEQKNLCFGNKEMINEHLHTSRYCRLFSQIPQEHLYASSVIHPDDESTCGHLGPSRVITLRWRRHGPALLIQ